MITYKLYKNRVDAEPIGAYYIKKDGYTICFLFDPANTDYQEYLKWVAEGNTPLPADGV